MHVTIHRYATPTGATDRTMAAATQDVVQAGRRLAPSLSRLPGFVSFVILETDGGGLVTVCTFEDRPGLEQAARLAGEFLAAHPVGRGTEREAITGRIVFQRGL